jgi:hypothetical protein
MKYPLLRPVVYDHIDLKIAEKRILVIILCFEIFNYYNKHFTFNESIKKTLTVVSKRATAINRPLGLNFFSYRIKLKDYLLHF